MRHGCGVLLRGFCLEAGGVAPSGGGSAKMLAVCPGKGAVSAKTGTETGIGGADAGRNQFSGQFQPPLGDVLMDAGADRILE